jgi:hypothetical protein
MSFEMLRGMVERRLQDGATPDQIRAELAGMGISSGDADRLLAAERPEGPKSRAAIGWWDILPLIPMWLAPVVLIVLAAILETPKLAIAMAIIGVILHLIGRICTIVLAFSEGILWGILLFFCPCIVELMLLFVQFGKYWKVLACEYMGIGLIIWGVYLDPKAVSDFFELENRARRRGAFEQVEPAREGCLAMAGAAYSSTP